MDIKQMIGARIAERRRLKGLTQVELADKMGIGPKYLSRIECGKENPTLNLLINLSEALKIDLGEIFKYPQLEDPERRRVLVFSLLEKADDEQIKLIYNIVAQLIEIKIQSPKLRKKNKVMSQNS